MDGQLNRQTHKKKPGPLEDVQVTACLSRRQLIWTCHKTGWSLSHLRDRGTVTLLTFDRSLLKRPMGSMALVLATNDERLVGRILPMPHKLHLRQTQHRCPASTSCIPARRGDVATKYHGQARTQFTAPRYHALSTSPKPESPPLCISLSAVGRWRGC